MAQREWVEKDFYQELGVSSDASPEEIKRAYRKLARDLHPDANPGNPAAGERFKAVSEAHNVLSDPAKRKEYDETRRLFAGGGFGGRRFDSGFGGGFGG
ncbi:DnaJ domain-containing protein, partial [Mycobacterium tuberculosis]